MMDRHPELARHGRCKGVCRQVAQLGHPQVGDGDEVLGRAVSACRPLGLLKLPVHRLDEGVAPMVEHAAHDRVEALASKGLRQGLQKLSTTSPTALVDKRKARLQLRENMSSLCVQRENATDQIFISTLKTAPFKPHRQAPPAYPQLFPQPAWKTLFSLPGMVSAWASDLRFPA